MASEAALGWKGVLRELRRYKSGILGLTIVIILIIISIYALATLSYDEAVRLWSSSEVWLDNPRNAAPVWINFILGRRLPPTIVVDSSKGGKGVHKIVRVIPKTSMKMFEIRLLFDYDYDDFPSEINLFLRANFSKHAPRITVTWVKPSGSRIRLADLVMRSKSHNVYISVDERILRRIQSFVIRKVGRPPSYRVPAEVALFAVEDDSLLTRETAKPLGGRYQLLLTGMLFEEGSDVDARLVVYGKVHGIAGTDHLRRDLSIALLWGTPLALAFGLAASLSVVGAQLILATISGWYGGLVDSVVQRITEFFMVLPFLPFLIMVSMFYKLDLWTLLLVVIGLSIFGRGIKIYRALVLQLREEPYVEAALAYGASNLRIIFLYLMPRIVPLTVPDIILSVPDFVFLEAALAFLGLGDPRVPTWGKVLHDAFVYGALYKGYYYWVLEPSALLVMTAIAFASLGFALDKILNPRLREM